MCIYVDEGFYICRSTFVQLHKYNCTEAQVKWDIMGNRIVQMYAKLEYRLSYSHFFHTPPFANLPVSSPLEYDLCLFK